MSLTEIQAAIAQPSLSEQALVLQWVVKDSQGASAGIESTYANKNIFSWNRSCDENAVHYKFK